MRVATSSVVIGVAAACCVLLLAATSVVSAADAVSVMSGGADAAAAANCSWVAPDGTLYDLTDMYTDDGYIGTDTYLTFKMNICGAQRACLNPDATLCSFWKDDGTYHQDYASWSRVPEPVWSQLEVGNPSAGVQLAFANGRAYCMGNLEMAIIQLKCDPDVVQTVFSVVEDFNNCTVTVTLKSKYACPSGGGPIIDKCSWTEPTSGLTWDLWPLHRSLDYVTASATYNYSLAICDTTASGGLCEADGHSVCQYNFRGQYVAGLGGMKRTPAGRWNLLAPDPTIGVEQVFNNGEVCVIKGRQVPRKLVVQFYCEPHGPVAFTVYEDTANCIYTLTFKVSEGCPHRRMLA